MRVPVWVTEGDIQCCQPDLSVGEEWTALPMLRPDVSDFETMPGPVDQDGRPIAVLEAIVQPAPGSSYHAPLVRTLGLVVGAWEEVRGASRIPFSLVHDPHEYGDPENPVEDYPPALPGVVRELWGINYEYRVEGIVPIVRIPTADKEVRRLSTTALPGPHQFRTYDRGFTSFVAVLEIPDPLPEAA
jgi:hypothetical protein